MCLLASAAAAQTTSTRPPPTVWMLRDWSRDVGPGDNRVLATFATLVVALAWIARAVR
jgi:hypothetical protein